MLSGPIAATRTATRTAARLPWEIVDGVPVVVVMTPGSGRGLPGRQGRGSRSSRAIARCETGRRPGQGTCRSVTLVHYDQRCRALHPASFHGGRLRALRDGAGRGGGRGDRR